MTEDERHLDLLGTFHYVVGGLLALFSCIFIIHIVIGLAWLSGAFSEGGQGPPREFGLLFVLTGGVAVIFGWATAIVMIMAGSRLRRRRSRTYCLVAAGISCMYMPFGTVLGILTIITLTKNSVIQLFEGQEGYGGPL